MKLSTTIWLVFAFCLLAVLAAMGWLSATALRLDRAEIESRRQAIIEEKVCPALWRMDSALAPMVAQESARPFFAYLAYFPADRSFSRMFNSRITGETMIASPLLTETPPRILVHFQFDDAGNLTSPQVPGDANRNMAPSLQIDSQVQAERERYLGRIQKLASPEKLAALLPEPKLTPVKIVYSPSAQNEQQRKSSKNRSPEISQGDTQSREEYAQRMQAVQQSANVMMQNQAANSQSFYPAQQGLSTSPQGTSMPQETNRQPAATPSPTTTPLPGMLPSSGQQQQLSGQLQPESPSQQLAKNDSQKPENQWQQPNNPLQQPDDFQQPQAVQPQSSPQPNTDFSGVLMTPLWIDGQLILARRVLVDGKQYVQGCLLDWTKIRKWLLGEIISDLLPEADLEPTKAASAAEESRRLAALPIRLVPGAVAVDGEKNWSPLLISLVLAWFCLFMTAAAVAGLLWGVMRLSARRASFVTAVTHELRTPLTTFQMYAEMLAEGMVPEESQRKQYLNTLRAEAVRLTHLVENVLAYARLERGRLDRRLKTVSLAELIGSMQNRLTDRAAHAGMELVIEEGSNAGDIVVKTNVSAVEQILFNLVDNACKYASSADDKRIRLALEEEDGEALLRVEDYGPGIAPEMRRRLFRSFSKTAKEAAHSAPGVGLGLALSRRLARDLGGDLSYVEHSARGACFILTLPLA